MRPLFQQITQKIITAIEAGPGEMTLPWYTAGNILHRPINAASLKPYRGLNVVGLWVEALARGFQSSKWATYRQWTELGAQVRKGEKSSGILFWQTRNGAPADESEPDARSRFVARSYGVFNADQVDGFREPPAPLLPQLARIANADAYIRATGAVIEHGGDQAFFAPGRDLIQLPPFEQFRDAEGYYAVLAHELIHWTGAKHRLARDFSGRFGTRAYAFEELVAELGAAFFCADLEISLEPRPDHAEYLASWLTILRDDPRALLKAASQAQAAVDFINGFGDQIDDVPVSQLMRAA